MVLRQAARFRRMKRHRWTCSDRRIGAGLFAGLSREMAGPNSTNIKANKKPRLIRAGAFLCRYGLNQPLNTSSTLFSG